MDRVGPTIVGRRNTPGVDAARDLLGRNDVPHRWVDLDRDPLGEGAMSIALVHSYLATLDADRQ
jgi:hypothetical protein